MANTGWQGSSVNPSKLDTGNRRIRVRFNKFQVNKKAFAIDTTVDWDLNGTTDINLGDVIINVATTSSASSEPCSGCRGY